MLFGEVDFLDRFEAAARAGFRGVEAQFPYDWPAEAIAERQRRHRLELVLHNLPAGDWARGERGIACHPGREAEFREGVERALRYAAALGCQQVNCLAGIAPAGVAPEAVRRTFVANLRLAAARLGEAGLRLNVEAVNTRDVPGFWLDGSAQAVGILDEVGAPRADRRPPGTARAGNGPDRLRRLLRDARPARLRRLGGLRVPPPGAHRGRARLARPVEGTAGGLSRRAGNAGRGRQRRRDGRHTWTSDSSASASWAGPWPGTS
jgi:hypothetical protein